MNINLMLRRIAGFVIDGMICSTIIVAPDLIINRYNPNETLQTICFLIGFTLIILKDILGRSLGKKLFNLYIVDKNTRKKPKVWKLICRNLLLPLWLIDSFVCFGTKGQRVADMILKLEVIEGEYN